MTAMNPLNGMRQRPNYAMAPEYTNNNYMLGVPGQGASVGMGRNIERTGTTTTCSRDGGFRNDVGFMDGNTENQMNELYGRCLNQGALDSDNISIHMTNVQNSSLTDENSLDLNNPGLAYQQVPSNNLTMGSGNFTFTSPTQPTVYSPGITSSSVNRFIQPHTFAPTSCLQWQHSVPQRIPWSACGTSACDKDILHFTGTGSTSLDVTFTSQTIPVCSLPPQRKSPIPSCSQPPRRIKRRAPDSRGNIPSKIHLTEDMISKHMQGLQLENGANSTTDPSSQVRNSPHWRKFLELEDRLSVSDEEEGSSQDGNQPRLHMVEDIVNMVNREPAIPQEIMHKISNPHMELVLWTPPGGAIKDFIESTNKSSQNTETCNSIDNLNIIHTDTVSHIQSLPNSLPVDVYQEEGAMDIETEDDLML